MAVASNTPNLFSKIIMANEGEKDVQAVSLLTEGEHWQPSFVATERQGFIRFLASVASTCHVEVA